VADFFSSLLGFVVRVSLLLAGLVFFAGLLMVALLLLLVWLLRAVWARLTGQPVSPWTFQVNRQAAWQFYERTQQRRGAASGGVQAGAEDVIDVTDATEVTDVQPKRITPR